MLESFQHLMNGFSIALSFDNLAYAFIGSLVGTLIGVLPGIGSAAGMAILIPITYQLPATGAIIMLAAIFYGSYYGGTVTTVLMNVPGEASSAITALDGYSMAKEGRAGAALSVAAIGSFIGGTVSVLGLVVASAPLTSLALKMGPPEFFALMAVGIALITGLAGKSMVKTLIMGAFGLLLAMIGTDPAEGYARFTFGKTELLNGLEFVPVIMGLFGVGEILMNLENPLRQVFGAKMSSLVPTRKDMKDCAWPITRGTLLGFFLGLVPGTTQSLASVLSYSAEVKTSKHPEKFGTGMIEGVAGPETANNAHANAALIPLFTLGIPGSPSVAVLLSAFMINGLAPGPLLFRDHADLAWSVIASMVVGNVILLVLNLPLIGMWVALLKIPYAILFPFILGFVVLGSYGVSGSMFDVGVVLLFGFIGYICKKVDLPLAPVALTLILGPLMESKFRLAMDMSQGDPSIFFNRPISAALLVLAAAILIAPGLGAMYRPLFGLRRVVEQARAEVD